MDHHPYVVWRALEEAAQVLSERLERVQHAGGLAGLRVFVPRSEGERVALHPGHGGSTRLISAAASEQLSASTTVAAWGGYGPNLRRGAATPGPVPRPRR